MPAQLVFATAVCTAGAVYFALLTPLFYVGHGGRYYWQHSVSMLCLGAFVWLVAAATLGWGVLALLWLGRQLAQLIRR